MKLAVLADVHANLEALEAVLDHLGDWPDEIVIAGDLIGYGADPNAVVARIRATRARCVWGNHEGMLLGRLGMRKCIYAGIRAILWTRQVLQPEARQWLETLPFDLDIAPGVRMVHAAPHDPEKYLNTPARASEALATVGPDIRVLIAGHTHEPVLWNGGSWSRAEPGSYKLEGRVLLNPGAVGQSVSDQPVARYARLDLTANTVTFHAIDYPWQRTAEKIKAAGLVSLLCDQNINPGQRLLNAVRTRWLRWTVT